MSSSGGGCALQLFGAICISYMFVDRVDNDTSRDNVYKDLQEAVVHQTTYPAEMKLNGQPYNVLKLTDPKTHKEFFVARRDVFTKKNDQGGGFWEAIRPGYEKKSADVVVLPFNAALVKAAQAPAFR